MRYGRRSQLVVFILVSIMLFMIQAAFARPGSTSTGVQDFWLEGWSSRYYVFDCNVHDTLCGELEVKQDGDLFPGDQTKYDIWLIQGINVLIMNQTNYNLWLDGKEAAAIVEADHMSSFSWSIGIECSGLWYVLCWSDSVFRKHIEMSVSQVAALTPAGALLMSCIALFPAFIIASILRIRELCFVHV